MLNCINNLNLLSEDKEKRASRVQRRAWQAACSSLRRILSGVHPGVLEPSCQERRAVKPSIEKAVELQRQSKHAVESLEGIVSRLKNAQRPLCAGAPLSDRARFAMLHGARW